METIEILQNYFDPENERGIFHADDAIEGDRTLCGIALETCDVGSSNRLVNCPHCAAIIAHCCALGMRSISRPVKTRLKTANNSLKSGQAPCCERPNLVYNEANTRQRCIYCGKEGPAV